MDLFNLSIQKMLKNLYRGEDHRVEVLSLINTTFLDFTTDFLKRIVDLKIKGQKLDENDWYKDYLIDDENLNKEEIANNAGLNMKTIKNSFGTERKTMVLDVSKEHYDVLIETIEDLVDIDDSLEIELKITYNKVSVELTLSETLIVINTLAVKRAAIVGGFWSKMGKNIEKPLMESLCILYEIPEENYSYLSEQEKDAKEISREVDYYLINNDGEEILCEVKMMGKGNPESADAAFARDTNILVADSLSATNKGQLNNANIDWIQLSKDKDDDIGFEKFESILTKYKIPHNNKKTINLEMIDEILDNKNLYKK